MKRLFVVLAALLAFACDETDECRRLDRIKTENEEVLHQAERRAAQAETIEKRMQSMKAKADEVFADLGLDQAEDAVTKTFEARAKENGATVERGIDVGGNLAGGGGTETQWTFEFSAKSTSAAWATAEKLMAIPPLARLIGLSPMSARGRYRLEISRGIVDRAPMKVKPTPLPKLRDPSEVASQFGFCGADEKRAALAQITKKVEELTPQAEALSVNLPLAASWEGLYKRAEVIRDIEEESRRIVREVLAAADSAKVKVKAAGVENDIVIVELIGGKKERGRVEQAMPSKLVEQLQKVEGSGTKVERLMIVNRHAEKRREAKEKLEKAIEKQQQQKGP